MSNVLIYKLLKQKVILFSKMKTFLEKLFLIFPSSV